jgi:hypothetical protein
VAAAAGGHPFGLDAVLVDFASAGSERRITRPARERLLARIVLRERLDRRIVELGGHAPHVADGVRIAARLAAEVLELRHQVVGVLTCEARKLRLHAVAARSVAGTACPDSETLGEGLGRGIGLIRPGKPDGKAEEQEARNGQHPGKLRQRPPGIFAALVDLAHGKAPQYANHSSRYQALLSEALRPNPS